MVSGSFRRRPRGLLGELGTNGTFLLSEKIIGAAQNSRNVIENVPSVLKFPPSVPVYDTSRVIIMD